MWSFLLKGFTSQFVKEELDFPWEPGCVVGGDDICSGQISPLSVRQWEVQGTLV